MGQGRAGGGEVSGAIGWEEVDQHAEAQSIKRALTRGAIPDDDREHYIGVLDDHAATCGYPPDGSCIMDDPDSLSCCLEAGSEGCTCEHPWSYALVKREAGK